MYGHERRRIDTFELCWRRLLSVLWIARSDQSMLKEINSEYSLEGLTLKLKLHKKSQLIGKDLMLGKIEGKRRRGQQSMRWLDGITNSMDMSFSKFQKTARGQGGLVCCSLVAKSWTQFTDEQQRRFIDLIWILVLLGR